MDDQNSGLSQKDAPPPNTDTGLTQYDPADWQSKRTDLQKQIEDANNHSSGPTIGRFILSCLSAIPAIGGAIGGVAGVWSEREQNKVNDLFISWLKLQEDELKEIGKTLGSFLE